MSTFEAANAPAILSRPAEVDKTIFSKLISALLPGQARLKIGRESFLSLSALLLDPSQPLKLRRQAAWQIAKLGSDEGLAILRQALSNAPILLKATIAEALGHSGQAEAKALIYQLLADKEETVVRGAIRGLAALGDGEAATRLTEILQDAGKTISLRAEAAIALGAVEHATASQSLIKLATAARDKDLLSAALTGLGQRPFHETEEFYRSFLSSADTPAEMRALALESMGQGSSDATPFLTKYLDAEEPEVRAAAAWALANLEEPGSAAQPLLARLARETEPEVRTRIYQALENQISVDSLSLLPFVLSDSNTTARVAGFKLLAEQVSLQGGPELLMQFDKLIVPRLGDLAMRGGDLNTRLSSVIALRRANTTEAIQMLATIATKSTDKKVVQAAKLK